MLPSYASAGLDAQSVGGRSRRSHYAEDAQLQPGSLFRYLRRVVRYPEMDFQYTLSQMRLLLHAPSKVYKLTSWRNQTKAQWARDDPAFVVLLSLLVAAGAAAYALALGAGGLAELLLQVAAHLALFLGSGLLVASLLRWLANAHLRQRHSHSVEQQVEWMYAFDIHCNGYWPLALLLYPVQLVLLPLLSGHSFLATLAANTLWCAALAYYSYITFLGYMYLPFLAKDRVTALLYPVAAYAVLFTLLTVINVNATRFSLSFFFSNM
jgi:hypothetical protein